MPPIALSTTKRKFHKLLDSLAANASSTSLPSHHSTSTTNINNNNNNSSNEITRPASSNTPFSPSKRPRTTLSTRRPTGNMPPSSSSSPSSTTTVTTIRPIPASSSTTTTTRSNSDLNPPNFAPWDRAAFLTRLQTFRFVDKWRAKPAKISEVEWARRGWRCVGVERVGCAGCGGEVVVKLGPESTGEDGKGRDGEEKEEEEGGGGRGEDGWKAGESRGGDEDGEDWRRKAQEELVQRYEELIRTGHAEGCLWRRRGCDDLIQRLPVVQQAVALEGLKGRYAGLAKMGGELPREVDVAAGVDVGRAVEVAKGGLLSSKGEAAEEDGLETTEVNRSALLLALFGWQAEEGHISGLAACAACFRRLGLWLFKEEGSSMQRLDVVGEHREYCPWINALSQNGAGRRSSLDGLAGWEMLLRAVNARAARDPLGENANGTVGREEGLEEGGDGDGGGDTGSFVGSVGGDQEKTREERDKERWAKLKKLKQVFQVKKRPGTSGSAATVRTGSSIV